METLRCGGVAGLLNDGEGADICSSLFPGTIEGERLVKMTSCNVRYAPTAGMFAPGDLFRRLCRSVGFLNLCVCVQVSVFCIRVFKCACLMCDIGVCAFVCVSVCAWLNKKEIIVWCFQILQQIQRRGDSKNPANPPSLCLLISTRHIQGTQYLLWCEIQPSKWLNYVECHPRTIPATLAVLMVCFTKRTTAKTQSPYCTVNPKGNNYKPRMRNSLHAKLLVIVG